MTQEKPDELRARKWLELQGYSDIQRPRDDPPDYVVEGCYAVEVRRLNRMEKDWKKPLEGWEEALKKTIQTVLAEFGPPTEGQVVYVDCDYPFQPPPPDKRVVERVIRQAIKSVKLPENSLLELKLECGIRLFLCPPVPSESATAKFMVNEVCVATAHTGWVLSELREHIPRCIEEKSRKVRGKDRVDDYSEWWLLLVDYIEYVSGLTEPELESLKQDIRRRDFWKRIVIISPENPKWFYEL